LSETRAEQTEAIPLDAVHPRRNQAMIKVFLALLISAPWGLTAAYNPTTGNLKFLADFPIWYHTATLLANDTVLIMGGVFFNGSGTYNDYGVESVGTSQVYNNSPQRF
jgi:hypothetical protein